MSVSLMHPDLVNMCDPRSNKNEHNWASTEDHQRLLFDDTEASYRPARKIRSSLSFILVPLFSAILFASGVWVGKYMSTDLNAICLDHVQKWSPLQEEVDNSYHIRIFNGSFLKENVFRQLAGPEVDAAWDSLGVNYRALAVPESQLLKSGLNPSNVHIKPVYGGGYPANVEGLHHLHCLNLIRQALYYNIDYYRSAGKGAFVNEENIVQYHVSHCLDIIRQQLMCVPDTGLFGQVWWDQEAPKAFVNFNTEHKCKDFEAIRKWAEARQIPEHVPKDFLVPPQSREDVLAEIP